MTAQPTWAEVTVKSLRRALYIDFEGQKDKPPVLLGCATKTGKKASSPPAWQYITDSTFEPLARAGEMELLSLPAAVLRIIQRAEKKDRQIVAWSEHELNVVKTYCPEHLERFESRYVNARSYAVRWRNKCHGGEKPEVGTLANYLVQIGHSVPKGAGPGDVGKTIGLVRKSLEKGIGVDGLTESQQRRWDLLREHNRHDCVGMRKVCLCAAEEIEAFEARSTRSIESEPRRTRSRRRRA